jgi:hypothetical protein
MRSSAELSAVEQLVANGLNDCEGSRQTGIPRTTVRDWRRLAFSRAGAERAGEPELHKHDFDRLPPAYAYLLGLYLGDGCISKTDEGCTGFASRWTCATPGCSTRSLRL